MNNQNENLQESRAKLIKTLLLPATIIVAMAIITYVIKEGIGEEPSLVNLQWKDGNRFLQAIQRDQDKFQVVIFANVTLLLNNNLALVFVKEVKYMKGYTLYNKSILGYLAIESSYPVKLRNETLYHLTIIPEKQLSSSTPYVFAGDQSRLQVVTDDPLQQPYYLRVGQDSDHQVMATTDIKKASNFTFNAAIIDPNPCPPT